MQVHKHEFTSITQDNTLVYVILFHMTTLLQKQQAASNLGYLICQALLQFESYFSQFFSFSVSKL